MHTSAQSGGGSEVKRVESKAERGEPSDSVRDSSQRCKWHGGLGFRIDSGVIRRLGDPWGRLSPPLSQSDMTPLVHVLVFDVNKVRKKLIKYFWILN